MTYCFCLLEVSLFTSLSLFALSPFMYVICHVVFFFKHKTAYEMRFSDWSSYVCSSDVLSGRQAFLGQQHRDAVVDAVDGLAIAGDQRLAQRLGLGRVVRARDAAGGDGAVQRLDARLVEQRQRLAGGGADEDVEQLAIHGVTVWRRSEEHTSELQSLMRIS